MVSIPARTNPARRGRSRRARRAQGFLPRRLVRGAETGSTFLVPGRRLRTPALSGIPSGFSPLPSPDPWAIADLLRSGWNTTQKAASGKLMGRSARRGRSGCDDVAYRNGLRQWFNNGSNHGHTLGRFRKSVQLSKATKQQDNEFQLPVNRNFMSSPTATFSRRNSLFTNDEHCGFFCTLADSRQMLP